MKLRLFLVSSLALLGLWLAAAFQHDSDLKTYHPQTPELVTIPVSVE